MKRPDGAMSDGADELDESLLPRFGGSAGAEPNATNQPTNNGMSTNSAKHTT